MSPRPGQSFARHFTRHRPCIAASYTGRFPARAIHPLIFGRVVSPPASSSRRRLRNPESTVISSAGHSSGTHTAPTPRKDRGITARTASDLGVPAMASQGVNPHAESLRVTVTGGGRTVFAGDDCGFLTVVDAGGRWRPALDRCSVRVARVRPGASDAGLEFALG